MWREAKVGPAGLSLQGWGPGWSLAAEAAEDHSVNGWGFYQERGPFPLGCTSLRPGTALGASCAEGIESDCWPDGHLKGGEASRANPRVPWPCTVPGCAGTGDRGYIERCSVGAGVTCHVHEVQTLPWPGTGFIFNFRNIFINSHCALSKWS